MLPSAVEQKNGQEYSFHVTNRNSVIATFGEGLLQIDLGLRRSFPSVFTLANTIYSILGVDFLRHFNLLINVKHHRLLDASIQLCSQ